MTRERFLTIAVVFLLVLNAGVVLFLFLSPKPGPPRGPELFEVIVRELDLDEGQQQQFFVLRDEHRSAMNELDKRFSDSFNQYLNLLTQSTIDAALRDSLENEMAGIEKAKAAVTLAHFEKVKRLCGAEQQEKFNQLIRSNLSELRWN
ncbi:MAG: periplasmic heavy metal sensor [Cyclobacteriaceae bacterium]|nr:periplasmic heavy metal sensor [Cyclobacteriaceae bacterium]